MALRLSAWFAQQSQRLFVRLFLAIAMVTFITLAAVTAWRHLRLEQGLLAYANESLAQRIEHGIPRLLDVARRRGGLDHLASTLELDRVLGLLPNDEPPRHNGPPGPSRPNMAEADRPLRPERELRGPPFARDRGPPPRRPPHGPPLMRSRISLLDAQQRLLVGPPLPALPFRTWPLVLDGRPIGQLAMTALPALETDLDLDLAGQQARDAVRVALVALLVASCAAWFLTRGLLKPLATLSTNIKSIAAGQFETRIAPLSVSEFTAVANDVNRLAESLQANQAARQRWGADIAHELRTPVAILQGELQALQDGVRALDKRALDSLENETIRLSRLIEDLYQLAMVDAGALDYRFATRDMVALVRDTCEAMRCSLEASGLSLALALPSSAAYAEIDGTRMQQLLCNILENSRRYTDAPGNVLVTLTSNGTQIQVRIEDSAPGVSDEALPRLFERLYRADPARRRGSDADDGGAGLGLSIALAVAQAHRASLSAEHAASGGLAVILTLPQMSPPRADHGPA